MKRARWFRKIAVCVAVGAFLLLSPSRIPAAELTSKSSVAAITWSRTSEPGGVKKLPVAKWVWGDVKGIDHSKTSNVWDGGTVDNRYIINSGRDWDIATWPSSYDFWSGTADVRRFHGEFTVPEGYDAYDAVTLVSTGDYSSLGLEDIVAVNDDIYVFVYPRGMTLSDNPDDEHYFMDYLAFWTGTALSDTAKAYLGYEIEFHGVGGTQPHNIDTEGDPDHLLSHTDGWYCEAVQNNVGYIMERTPQLREFVVDIFVEDYAETGGMDRFNLVFTKTEKRLFYTVEYYRNATPVTDDTQIVTAVVPPDAPDIITVETDEINVVNKYAGFQFNHIEYRGGKRNTPPAAVESGETIKVYYTNGNDTTDGNDNGGGSGSNNRNPTPPENPPVDTTPEGDLPVPPFDGGENPNYVPSEDGGYTVISDDGRTIGRLIPNERPDKQPSYILIDNDDVPLGEWSLSGATNTWIFDEYPPLAAPFLPTTGNDAFAARVLAGLLLIACAFLLRRNREY